jgi:hypothetical protein
VETPRDLQLEQRVGCMDGVTGGFDDDSTDGWIGNFDSESVECELLVVRAERRMQRVAVIASQIVALRRGRTDRDEQTITRDDGDDRVQTRRTANTDRREERDPGSVEQAPACVGQRRHS